MTSDEVRAALRRHYGLTFSDLVTEEWTLHDEVGISRWGGATIDVLAVRAWGGMPSGHERHAVEIKVSRGDFLRELRSQKWYAWQQVVHRFYFAAPVGVIPVAEVPPGCGLLVVHEQGIRKTIPAPRHDPEPLDEQVWVALARRASRLAERLRRGDDPAAELAALRVEHRKLAATVDRQREAATRYRERIAQILAALPLADVVCSACREAMTFAADRGRWRWQHAADPGRYCAGQPVPRDLLDTAGART